MLWRENKLFEQKKSINILTLLIQYIFPKKGFLDLQSRLAEVVSMLEVGPDWLEPTKYDLTFTNVKTQKCLINNTEVILNVVIDNSKILNKNRNTN